MNIVELLLGSDTKNAVAQLAQKLGISEQQARELIAEVAPAMARGMQHNAQADSGVEGLMNALRTGNHSRYIEQPQVLGTEANIEDGNSILGHIFGSKDVSRNVAAHASQETGISSTLIKKALPIIATMVMGTLGKTVFGSTGANTSAANTESAGFLTSLLDSDRDGSVVDDILGMAFKMAFR